jgi:hypothetical protein
MMWTSVVESVSGLVTWLPVPPGPDAPPEVTAKVVKGLTLLWYAILAGCMAIAMYGVGSMAFFKRKERYDEANQGLQLATYAVGGAVGVGLLAPVFNFMGIV